MSTSRPNWRRGAVPKPAAAAVAPAGAAAAAGDAAHYLNPENSTAIVFYEAALEFAGACADVWPSDAIMAAETARLVAVGTELEAKQAEGARLAAAFHAAFAGHYAMIQSKDAAFFALPHPGLVAVHAAAKYASAAPALRDTVWEYLRSLMQYAGMVDMYSKCPRGMLDSISNMAHGLIGKLQTGEMDASKLNPLELGQMMMQSMSAEDLESFGSAVMSGGNMESMMTLMQSAMGGGGAPDGGAGGGAGGMGGMGAMGAMLGGSGGGLDIGSLMGMLGGGAK